MQENYFEEEKKKRNLETKEKDKNYQEKMKKLEKLFLKNNIRLSLEELKKLVQENVLDMVIVEKYFDKWDLEETEISTIFDKIDEIENINKIDDLIPREFRVNKAEYLLALQDMMARKEVKQKIDMILTYIAMRFQWDERGFWLVFFYMSTLEKNLIKIQENTIDMQTFLDKNPIW